MSEPEISHLWWALNAWRRRCRERYMLGYLDIDKQAARHLKIVQAP